MSWDQAYSVPSYLELLVKLTGKHPEELLEAELQKQGIRVSDTEEVLLDEGMYQDVKGLKVTLSDGRVFVPKLVEQYTENGNYGCDTYDWVLEDETPEVRYINGDEELAEEVGEIPEEYENDVWYGGEDNCSGF